MAHRIFEPCECSVVEECHLQANVSKRRCAKLIPIIHITRDLFEAEIFVRSRAIKDAVGDGWRYLRYAYHVICEVAEHLVRLARYCVTFYASCFAKEEQR